MKEIDWAQAPDDADAAVIAPGAIAAYGHWRKFVGDVVYYYKQDEWHVREGATADKWKRANKHVLRPAPKENPLPDGKVWFEHATYFNPAGDNGFFFLEKEFYWGGEWRHWQEHDFKYWSSNINTIKRFPNGEKPQVKQEQPKKPLGWWS